VASHEAEYTTFSYDIDEFLMFQTIFRLLSQNSELSIKAGQALYETNEPTVNLLNQ
jgi:hypothetical protein